MTIKQGQGGVIMITDPALYGAILSNQTLTYTLVRGCDSVNVGATVIDGCADCTIRLFIDIPCAVDLGVWQLAVLDGSDIIFSNEIVVIK